MVLDYRERKQVNKNRSKNRPVNLIVLTALGILLGIYFLGIATGWVLHAALKKNPAGAPAAVTADVKQKTKVTPPASNSLQNRTANNTRTSEPPLSFYYTLPKGEKMALGSGLNPAKREKSGDAGSATAETANSGRIRPHGEQRPRNASLEHEVSSPAQSSAASRSGDSTGNVKAADVEISGKPSASNKAEAARRKYTVQVASYDNKKEADALKYSLDKAGLLSYVVEAKVTGKGTRYRVRLGSRLDLDAANKLAAKAGKGAIIIPE